MEKTTIMSLLDAGVHFGHMTRRWNPKMKPYIYGTRNGITIFDLRITMHRLADACDFLHDVAVKGGQILFVGAKRQAQECVREIAERLNMPYMCDRWLGGTLTNQKIVLTRIKYMKKLQAQEADGSLENLPKKEVAGIRRDLAKLQTTLGGIADMTKLPDAMIVVDVAREHIAVAEAHRLGIPVVAIVDSNCNPDLVDYVVPRNDDALRSIKVLMDTMAASIEDGLNEVRSTSASENTADKDEAPAEAEAAAEK